MSVPARTSAFTLTLTDGVGVITFDAQDSLYNAFSSSVMDEFDRVLDDVTGRPDLRGAVFTSGRAGQYNIGANLDELAGTDLTPEWARRFAERGQQLLMRVAALPVPTVAAIDGETLGGGAEFALAADMRIATPNQETRIGFPETKLGLIPCWGGTQRLPRAVGLNHAVSLICSGDSISAERAVEIGLVYRVVPSDRLLAEAFSWIMDNTASERAATEWQERRQGARRPLPVDPSELPLSRACAGQKEIGVQPAEGQTASAAAVRAIRDGCPVPLEDGLAVERDALVDLVAGGVSNRQIRKAAMARRLASLR